MIRMAVVRFGDGWKISCDQQPDNRTFAFRVDAEEVALQRCRELKSGGVEVELLVQHTNGELRPLLVMPPSET